MATDAKKFGTHQNPSSSSVINECIAVIRFSSAFNDKSTIEIINNALIAPLPLHVYLFCFCQFCAAILRELFWVDVIGIAVAVELYRRTYRQFTAL